MSNNKQKSSFSFNGINEAIKNSKQITLTNDYQIVNK
jgi:hypothetical protein